MCEVASFRNFENSLTTVKVITKTKVAPFYLGHGVYMDVISTFSSFRTRVVDVCFSEIKVDCIRVSAIPIKTIIDDHIQRLFDALLGSLRRSIHSDITDIDSFVTAALETISQRPQTVEEIGEANAKHMEFSKRKKEVTISAT